VAVATEASPDEAPVVRGLGSLHKRPRSTGKPEGNGIDGGRGIEVGTAKAPRNLDLPPGLEQQRGQGLPGIGASGKSFRRFTLDYEIGVLRWRIGLGEPPHDRSSPIERNVPQNLVGDIGQPKAQEVGPDDRNTGVGHEARAKRRGQHSVELHRDDLATAARQFSSENAAARPDFDDQIASFDGGLSDQASGKRPAPQEVLCEIRTPGCPMRGHDEPART